MSRPRTTTIQMPYRNPSASADLILPLLVICNTPDWQRQNNIFHNSSLDLPWVGFEPAHDRKAILCGGGPSLADHLDEIRQLQAEGGSILAMNAVSQFLRTHGIEPDAQVICDAKPESVGLYDPECKLHYIASQCDPAMLEHEGTKMLWHLAISENMEQNFPRKRVKAGGYALIGGGVSVGISATCLAYVLGFRTLEVFGYDSSHRQSESHAYAQPMNGEIPVVETEWAGRKFLTSVAMKQQAERFQFTAKELQTLGVTVNVHGDGLLPAMWNTDASQLTLKDKYHLLWDTDAYRDGSPAEALVPLIVQVLKPDSIIADFGCGTGRAGVALRKLGHNVLLVDFADNCRDEEAMGLPFLEWDLTLPMPQNTRFGMCCDVMEHIAPEDVAMVLENIMAAAEKVFFNISTIPDKGGMMIHEDLHLTVRPHQWWADALQQVGTIQWQQEGPVDSLFVVQRTLQ